MHHLRRLEPTSHLVPVASWVDESSLPQPAVHTAAVDDASLDRPAGIAAAVDDAYGGGSADRHSVDEYRSQHVRRHSTGACVVTPLTCCGGLVGNVDQHVRHLPRLAALDRDSGRRGCHRAAGGRGLAPGPSPTAVAMTGESALHPGAWWLWVSGLATAASRTTNPVLLGLVLAVAGFVVSARRTDAPWARAFAFALRLGVVVIVLRVVFAAIAGPPLPGRVLLHLPGATLPSWAAGVRLGGDVTLAAVITAVYVGLQLATVLACVGAANSLANPRRMLRTVPGALYEVGVAVVVALSFAPQLVEGVTRVRAARRLRGRPHSGVRGLRGVAMPVLHGALERSVDLAASMDSRGFGRGSGGAGGTSTRWSGALTLVGLLGVCVGLYGVLDVRTPPALGLPLLAAAGLVAGVGLVLGGRRSGRSRYRPDGWGGAEWLVAGSGLVAAVGFVVTGHLDPGALAPTTTPLDVPALPLIPAVTVLVALLPAWAAPAPLRHPVVAS